MHCVPNNTRNRLCLEDRLTNIDETSSPQQKTIKFSWTYFFLLYFLWQWGRYPYLDIRRYYCVFLTTRSTFFFHDMVGAGAGQPSEISTGSGYGCTQLDHTDPGLSGLDRNQPPIHPLLGILTILPITISLGTFFRLFHRLGRKSFN